MNNGENLVIYVEKTPLAQTKDVSIAILVLLGVYEILSIEYPKKANVLKLLASKFGGIPVRVGQKVNKLIKQL